MPTRLPITLKNELVKTLNVGLTWPGIPQRWKNCCVL